MSFPAHVPVSLHERPRPRLPRSCGAYHGDRGRIRIRDSRRPGREALHAGEVDSVPRGTRRDSGITGRSPTTTLLPIFIRLYKVEALDMSTEAFSQQ